jgi:CPA1 family monovalent cation:H+ antiporter
VAFTVTIGTLLLQGLTLPWLIRRLGISDPHEIEVHERQHKVAEEVSRVAMVAAIEAFRDRQPQGKSRQMAEMMLKRMSVAQSQQAEEWGIQEPALTELAGEMLAARRKAVVQARDERRLDDEVMREVLEEMDFEQASMEGRSPGGLGR